MTAVLAFLTAFAYRLSALYPSISPSDAGYLTQIHSWQWSHSPWGDPHLPLMNLFILMVPAGNALFRMNLFTALLAGLAAAGLVRLFLTIFPAPASTQMFVQMEDARWRKACAWISGLAVIAFPPVADVFRTPAPHALTILLLLTAILAVLHPIRHEYAAKNIAHYSWAGPALVAGMGLGTSYYFACFIPGLLDLVLSSRQKRSSVQRKNAPWLKSAAYGVAAFTAGFLIVRPAFLFDMARASLMEELLSLSEGLSLLGGKAVDSIHSLAGSFTPVGLFLCLWGVYNLRKHNDERSRALGLFILGAFIALPWTTPSFIALFFGVLAAYGIHDLGLRFFKRRSFGLAILGLSLALGLSFWDRQNLQARDLGLNAFQSLPENSIFIPRSRSLQEILIYTQKVTGLRRDVEIQEVMEASTQDTSEGHLESLEINRPDRLIFFEPGLPVPGKDLLPYGLAFRYFPARNHKLLNPPSQISLLRFTFWWYRRTAPWNQDLYRLDAATRSIVRRYAEAHLALAEKSREFGLGEFDHLENLAAISLDPDNYQALKNLGEEALERRDFSQATLFFQKALKTDSSDASLHFRMGQALQGRGRPMEALEAFQRAVGLVPDFRDARRSLAEAQDQTRRYDEAVVQWKWLMDQNPQDKDTVWRLIQDYHHTGRADKAKELLQEYFLMSLTPEEKSRAEIFYDVVMGRMAP